MYHTAKYHTNQQQKDNSSQKKHYKLDYNEEHEQPNWVYYRLTIDNVNGTANRKDDFRPDPDVKTGSATLEDYKNSGYDRGHLCPAADMKQSAEAMSETFFMSNMSPQDPSFNRGKWSNLEAFVRSWVEIDKDTLYIVTGPVFLGAKESIGANKVTVPKFYYKILYSPKRGMVAFLMPNRKISEPLYSWFTTVDMIEALTDIDFFPQLPLEVQNKLESSMSWEK